MPDQKLAYRFINTPAGRMLAARDESVLHYLTFPTGKTAREPRAGWVPDDSGFDPIIEQLDAYFAGELREFDIRFQLNGTEFQSRVWQALQLIPYGETWSYGELAEKIGKPTASRAVGAANGANPIPIIVPCHRVIGANNTLTGFGGGLDVKELLLTHEARYCPKAGTQLPLF